MKTFFSGLINKIKTDTKAKIITASVGAVVVVGIIVLICTVGGSDNSVREIADPVHMHATSTPVPTATPTPMPTATPVPTVTPTPEPTPTPDLHIDEWQSELTGEWYSNDVPKLRPYAVMLNNIGVANPQSGIGDASILYEALTEAGITRLMAIFEGISEESSCAERIGSVRSARHYFVSFADEYDAIFFHFGGPSYAEKKMKKLKIDHLDGISLEGIVYYRDKNIKAPHNAFTSYAGMLKGIEKYKIRTTHEDDWEPNHFTFNEEQTVPEGEGAFTADYINLPYSSYMTSWLTYNPETELYTRNQFGGVHIDYNTEQPLEFTNVIIQVVHEFDKDANGYQDMDLTDAEGHGFYISKGVGVPITWKKNEKQRFMMYYDSEGNVLSINPGRTFISAFPDFRETKLGFTEE